MAGKIGRNILGETNTANFFELSNPYEIGLESPPEKECEAMRTCVRSLSGFQKEALVRPSGQGIIWRLVSDEGPYLNGYDEAPCPLAFLTVGMAASYMDEIAALAEIRGIEYEGLRVEVDSFYTMKGSMQKRTMVGGAEPVEIRVGGRFDASLETVQSLVADGVVASPVHGLIRGKLANAFALASNGFELETAGAKQIAGSRMADPHSCFERAKYADHGPKLYEAVGETPRKKVELGTSKGGSSLSDDQNRRLNIGAISVMRDDGIKEIQQMQYSPHGTSFRFLSQRVEGRGGNCRAPDALSLVSAGIGFCFMTQFGRFASMCGFDLPEYRIVQDTKFSLGGATGRTGKSGKAEAIETHVYLVTEEDADVAREMLDVSEKTCFLHALCRTDLKPRINLAGLHLAKSTAES